MTQQEGNDVAWFADLRSKLAAFSMSEWLSSLGLGGRRKNSDTANSREAIYERHSGDQRVPEFDPISSSLTHDVDDDSTPTFNPHDSFELPNFWLNLEPGRSYQDTLELQHFGPLEDLVPVGKRGLGVGHEFQVVQLVNPTWCDKCGDFIWGFYKQAVRCQNCNYTCHNKCHLLVTLDCRLLTDSMKSRASASGSDIAFPTMKSAIIPHSDMFDVDNSSQVIESPEIERALDQVVIEQQPLQLPSHLPRGEELKKVIDEYNAHAEGLGMTLNNEPDSSFSGYIQIHMNFTRPINIVAGERPVSVYDVLKDDTLVPEGEGRKTITSFFLPRNTVKILHINSDTTTRQLVVSLLRKFKVADNPKKFALYERHFEPGETLISKHQFPKSTVARIMRNAVVAKVVRVSDEAFPLRLTLQWGANSGKRFVLQENDTGDILWDAFEIPELNNFLKILDMEEQQYIWQIRQRYNLYKHYLDLELRAKRGTGVEPSAPPLPESEMLPSLKNNEPPHNSTDLKETKDGTMHSFTTDQTLKWDYYGTV